jgi:hypothetical protein
MPAVESENTGKSSSCVIIRIASFDSEDSSIIICQMAGLS